MKKFFLAVFLATVPFFSFSQTSSGLWNINTATYTNTAHKITWQLIEDFDWIERPILSGTTLLKVRNDDTNILITLGADKKVGLKGDIWDSFTEQEHPQFENLYKQRALQNGMTYIGTKSMKCLLCGNHAIKKRIDMKKDYPEFKQTVHSIEIKYFFYKNNYIYTVSVMALSVVEEEIDTFERVASLLFNGFDID